MVLSKFNRVAGLVLATLLLLMFAAGAHAEIWSARVTNISDGDTITVIGPAAGEAI